ncbi:MAG: Kae1-associated serine/threonine protein kinase [Candidatus Aenigmarchaeota archaeon]|nr:Kae1-associated serine/threonine protein kinase [Candidatus Aenigmarchaeota archaeon]
MMEQIYRGAEAVVIVKGNTIIKERIRKSYRLLQIDEKLRKQRTRSEASLLREAARAGVNVPRIIEEFSFSLTLEKIEGKMVKNILNKNNMSSICKIIGKSIAKLHCSDIVHGDFTTSNMLIIENESTSKPFKLYLIDFGLGLRSAKTEDKATDLHVLREALESTHFNIAEKAWKIILKAYQQEYKGAEKAIGSLKNLEKRGRYRDRTG